MDILGNLIERLKEFIRQGQEDLQDIESGHVRHFEGRDGQPMVDVTESLAKGIRSRIERYTELLQASERNRRNFD